MNEQNSLIATDVKVAPGGTENVDTEIYEAVVSQPIVEPQVSLKHRNRFLFFFFLVPVSDPAPPLSSVCSPASVSTRVRSTWTSGR